MSGEMGAEGGMEAGITEDEKPPKKVKRNENRTWTEVALLEL